MRILIAGATGVIGRQAVRVLTAAGHDVVALARTPTRLPDVDVVAADALDATALTRAVRTAAPDVVVHMLTAIPDPLDPKHMARDMARTNRLRTEGTANPDRRRRWRTRDLAGSGLRLRPRRRTGEGRGRATVARSARRVRARGGRPA